MVSNVSDMGEAWRANVFWAIENVISVVSPLKSMQIKNNKWKTWWLWRPFGKAGEGKEVRLGSVVCPGKSKYRGQHWISNMSITGLAGSTAVNQSIPIFYRVHLNRDTAWGWSSKEGTEISQFTHFENQTPIGQKLHFKHVRLFYNLF